ncbi:MAG: DUF357 domain-containing protein [Candidatus Micrarchaeaceae archaeon]
MSDPEEAIKARIKKDIDLFYVSIGSVGEIQDSKAISKIVELSRMYAEDSKSFLEKGDLYTAFASINYAHGLLDAVIAIKK